MYLYLHYRQTRGYESPVHLLWAFIYDLAVLATFTWIMTT